MVVIVLVGAVVAAVLLTSGGKNGATARPGEAAPNFTLPDLNGRVHSLADFRGKKVLLVTWASW